VQTSHGLRDHSLLHQQQQQHNQSVASSPQHQIALQQLQAAQLQHQQHQQKLQFGGAGARGRSSWRPGVTSAEVRVGVGVGVGVGVCVYMFV